MAITDGLYQFKYGTLAQYQAKKTAGTLNANHFYFTTDTHQIFIGEDLYSGQFSVVTTFPDTGAQGILYINSDTKEAKVWNGTAWQVVSPAVSTTLDADTDAAKLATAGAIRDYVASQISGSGDVKDVSYDFTTQKFTVSYEGDKADKEMQLKELFTDVAYDGTTGIFTFTKADGATKTITTPVEKYLTGASYDKDTHILSLTVANVTDPVTVDLGDLIDVYTASDTSSISMVIDGKEISATVKKSAAEGNVLEIKDDGLYVPATDLSNYYTQEEVDAMLSWEAID